MSVSAKLSKPSRPAAARGMDRTSFYEWKGRFQTHGFDGLKDLPPVHQSHPMSAPPKTNGFVERFNGTVLDVIEVAYNKAGSAWKVEGWRAVGHDAAIYQPDPARHADGHVQVMGDGDHALAARGRYGCQNLEHLLRRGAVERTGRFVCQND